jgi:hypothetical protein
LGEKPDMPDASLMAQQPNCPNPDIHIMKGANNRSCHNNNQIITYRRIEYLYQIHFA